MTDIHYLDAMTIARKIHKREISSVETTEALLSRIETRSNLKAYVTVTAERALADARRADLEIAEGNIRSPLHGVPIAYKDLLATNGIKTTSGTSVYADHVPDYDATVVSRLAAAGTVMLGKLKLTEGAFSRHHPTVEIPQNPWGKNLWTGVSSSGSGVATAAGLCFGSLGTDTGGSIRFPASSNGVVGLKPTWGRVSRYGAFPLAYSLDHIGPITRTVDDAAAMLQIIAGLDPNDPTSSAKPVPDYFLANERELKTLRIGYDAAYVEEDTSPEHVVAIKDAMDVLRDLGCEIVPVNMPWHATSENWALTTGVEAAHAHRETFPERRDEYGAIAGLLDLGLSVTAETYMQIELERRNLIAQLSAMFSQCDVMICPSMPLYGLPNEGSPETDAAEEGLAAMLKFTAPFDYSGSPTLSIPWKSIDGGVPASVQLVGPDLGEHLLIELGRALESARGELAHPDLG